jgi:hypothetical protein
MGLPDGVNRDREVAAMAARCGYNDGAMLELPGPRPGPTLGRRAGPVRVTLANGLPLASRVRLAAVAGSH